MYFTIPKRNRYHRSDGWRGYMIPRMAVAGANDTGTWDDSPCPSPEVKAEIRRFQREVLQPLGIKSKTRYGMSSNVFCGKRWVCVHESQFAAAAAATLKWMEAHRYDTHYIYDADLDKLIVKEE